MSDGIYKTVTEADTASIPTYGQVMPAHGNGGCVGFSPIFPLIRQPEPSEPYPHIRFLLFYHRQRELSITAKKLPAVAGSFFVIILSDYTYQTGVIFIDCTPKHSPVTRSPARPETLPIGMSYEKSSFPSTETAILCPFATTETSCSNLPQSSSV